MKISKNRIRFRPRQTPFPSPSALVKQNFVSGVLVALPFVVIGWIFLSFIEWLWHLQSLLPLSVQPEVLFAGSDLLFLFQLLFTAVICGILILTFSLLGWSSKRFIGKKALDLLSLFILRIPVIRSIYSALDQLLRGLTSGNSKQFNRVVYVEYPRKGIWALAFVTGKAEGPQVPKGHLNLYVPTTPNPTSGFHLIADENEVRESGLTVEQAFKTILSLGIAQK